MLKLEETKSNPMSEKNFILSLTEVLRYFRDNGELKKAYESQKDSLADMANSSWVKALKEYVSSKNQEDGVDVKLPDIDELIKKLASDLDMCCGSRMFYFDKQDPQVLFTDIREYHDTLCDGRKLDVQPDMIADCTNLPFEDETFNMVVFDPPHLLKVGQNSWLCKKYGKLPENWQAFINDSIHEGMRVLKTNGTLIFKWNEQQIKVSDVLKAITDYKPIFGHRTTIKNQTIWMAFMK